MEVKSNKLQWFWCLHKDLRPEIPLPYRGASLGWLHGLHFHRGMGKHTRKSHRNLLPRESRQTGFHFRCSSCYLSDHADISVLGYVIHWTWRALLRASSRILMFSMQPRKFVPSCLEHTQGRVRTKPCLECHSRELVLLTALAERVADLSLRKKLISPSQFSVTSAAVPTQPVFSAWLRWAWLGWS